MAGLTAACYLARAGVGVTLFEKAPYLGGRAATREFDGFLFNLGGHALYTGGAASRVFEELGIAYDYGIPKGTFVLQGGEPSPFPADPLGLLRTDVLDAADKLALVSLFVVLGAAKPRALAKMSVQEWLDRKVRRPQLRRLMTAVARTFVYSTALDLVSAELFVEKFQRSLRHPVHYVDGGWLTLVDGLRAAAERAGARIVGDTHVEGVEIGDGYARGVWLRDGSLVRASAVVVATGSRDAAKLVDGGEHPAMRRILDGLTPARIACLDVALERLPVPDRPVVQDLDGPRFMSAQSVYSRVAPEGAALVIAFKQLDPRYPGDPREDERDLEDLLDAAQPGWRGALVKRQYLPRIEAVGALPTAREGGFAVRPGPRVSGLDNLYLAGDWIGPEGFLVDASVASARRAAQLIPEDGRPSREKVAAGSVR
ncbi:MAG: FAD-dependent oxidoreductase [Actinomycetota bacterium]|nr:FAD-dependent oxidoreductase [Actinomycetota bacterium]